MVAGALGRQFAIGRRSHAEFAASKMRSGRPPLASPPCPAMKALRKLLSRHRRLYLFGRSALMSFRRWKHGLKHVNSTFYLAKGSEVSRDLIAREYSYIGPGCLIGPKVELGPYG